MVGSRRLRLLVDAVMGSNRQQPGNEGSLRIVAFDRLVSRQKVSWAASSASGHRPTCGSKGYIPASGTFLQAGEGIFTAILRLVQPLHFVDTQLLLLVYYRSESIYVKYPPGCENSSLTFHITMMHTFHKLNFIGFGNLCLTKADFPRFVILRG